jgi:hypothetical protein
MQRRAFADWTGIAVGVVVVVAAGSLAFANEIDDNDQCCKSSPPACDDQGRVTDCIDGCASNEVCSGDAGCTPGPWADAECIDDGSVGP